MPYRRLSVSSRTCSTRDASCLESRQGKGCVDSEALLAFKRERDRERATSLDALPGLSQDLGGYKELSKED